MKKYSTNGDFENAIICSKKVLEFFDINHEIYFEALSILTHAYQSLGQHNKALSVLEQIRPAAKQIDSLSNRSHYFSLLGDLYLSLGKVQQGITNLEKAVQVAAKSNNLNIHASTLNNIGNAYISYAQYHQNEDFLEYYQKGMTAYRQSLEIIDKTPGNIGLKSNVTINMVLAEYQHDDLKSIIDSLQTAYKQNLLLPNMSQKAENILSLVWVCLQVLKKESWPDNIKLSQQDVFRMTYNMINTVKDISNNLNNLKYKSEVNGYLAQLYEMSHQYEEALTLTRKAIFFSEQSDKKDILYLWQSQLGRLFKTLGKIDHAITAYKNSVQTLQPIQTSLFIGLRNNSNLFENEIKPVYLGLSKIYFEKSTHSTCSKVKQDYLEQAWDIMEQMKTVELQNFFQDECVADVKNNHDAVFKKPHPKTAIIYPILFNDKPVLFLKLPHGLKHVVISVDSKKIKTTLYRFSNNLCNFEMYEDDAIHLYQWLIQPITTILKKNDIKTLVVAADGVFCLIPFAALFDGNQFLIEKYAVVTIPALALTNTDKDSIKKNNALLAGYSNENGSNKKNLNSLPNIKEEIETIKKIIGGKKLIDKSFNEERLKMEFENNSFSIIHMATHGNFGITPKQTFLLSADGTITLNELQDLLEISTYNKSPVELLTLSACQTATGNERVAFGMAGIAVKTGVKSVVATLWPVDDLLALKLLTEFYSQLSTLKVSKAEAMQHAQKIMIDDRFFNNPSQWASFLLIGNWL